MKQWVPITSKSSQFKGETQYYVVKLPKSAGARQYCPKIQRVPGTLGTHANSSPECTYVGNWNVEFPYQIPLKIVAIFIVSPFFYITLKERKIIAVNRMYFFKQKIVGILFFVRPNYLYIFLLVLVL